MANLFRHSSVPLRKGKSDSGTVDLLSTASSSNEDIRVIELPGAGAGGDDIDKKSKSELFLPVQSFTPLIRRLSSLELKGESVKQEDVKPYRIFVRDGQLLFIIS
jgi:hypothetical protein